MVSTVSTIYWTIAKLMCLKCLVYSHPAATRGDSLAHPGTCHCRSLKKSKLRWSRRPGVDRSVPVDGWFNAWGVRNPKWVIIYNWVITIGDDHNPSWYGILKQRKQILYQWNRYFVTINMAKWVLVPRKIQSLTRKMWFAVWSSSLTGQIFPWNIDGEVSVARFVYSSLRNLCIGHHLMPSLALSREGPVVSDRKLRYMFFFGNY